MKDSSRHFKIGAFVLFAAAIGVAAVVLFGAGELLRVTVPFETYVNESVQGLEIGAPVKLRGVQVGAVETIDFVQNRYDGHEHYVFIGMRIYPDRISGRIGRDLPRRLREEIEHGLRIRLASQGLTGGVYLEVDYVDPVLHPPLQISWAPASYYVPSTGSTGARVLERLERVITELDAADIDQIARRVATLLEEVSATVRGLEPVVKGFERVASDASRAAEDVRQVLKEDVAKKLSALLETLNFAVEKDVSPAVRSLHEVARALPPTIERANATLRKMDRVLTEQDRNLEEALDNLRVISEDVREMTGSLKKYPSQAIFGQAPPRGKAVEK